MSVERNPVTRVLNKIVDIFDGNGDLSPFPAAIQQLPHLQVNVDDVRVFKVLMTPEKAAALLLRNRNVRPIVAREVERYCCMLEVGKFWLNGESVKLDEDGFLVDGQHRLEACALTGIPFWTVVVTGVGSKGVDDGVRRNPGQLLAGVGIQNANVAAAMSRSTHYLRAGKDPWLTTIPLPNDVVVEEYEERLSHRLRDWAMQLSRYGINICARSVTATAAYLMAANSSIEEAEAFLVPLFSGANLEEQSPILHLRKWLADGGGKLGQAGRRANRAQFIAIFRALDLYRSGRSITRGAVIWTRIHEASLPLFEVI